MPKVGFPHSPESKKMIGDANRGKPKSEATKKKMSEAQKGALNHQFGKHPSEETRRMMSDQRRGELNPMFGKPGSMLGKHHTEATKQGLSERNQGERHPMFGKHHSPETRAQMSLSHKGNTAWVGKHHSESTKQKMSRSHVGNPSRLGQHLSDGHKERIGAALRGKPRSEATKQKISKGNRGKVRSAVTKQQIRDSLLGKALPPETRSKMSASRQGSLNPAWRGGLSFEVYTLEFTDALRRSIRERDNYTCQLCGAKQYDRAFSVHHIDYNKKNSARENLVTLCNSCHPKTNQNREHWMAVFAARRFPLALMPAVAVSIQAFPFRIEEPAMNSLQSFAGVSAQ